jgi:AraC-like DNA-binding protein
VDALISPDARLQAYVEGYWFRSGNYEPPRQVRVLADACTKLIFELAPMPWGSCYLIATQMAPIMVTLSGRVDRVGIRFRPGAASFFLHRSLDGLAGQLVPLALVEIKDGEMVLDRLRRAGGGPACAAMLDDWLLAMLGPDDVQRREFDDAMKIAALLRAGLAPPEVAAAMEWSERRLQRTCRKRFGASAASLHRLYRFELLHKRLAGEPVELAPLATELGYSDQAHMARDFRHFAQTSVSAFLRERAGVGNLQDGGGWLPVLRDLPEEV